MSAANETQVGGSHYQTSGIQHWDLCAAVYGQAHFKCTSSKYVSRWRQKNGKEDLDKAVHYLEKLIEINRVSNARMVDPVSIKALADFTANLPVAEGSIIHNIFHAAYNKDLWEVILKIKYLKESAL